MPALDERPILFPELAWLWKAYVRLDRSRNNGLNGPNPIAIADIMALADALEFTDVSQRLCFLDRIQLMDSSYFSEYRRKQPAKKGKPHGRAKN